MNTTKISHIAHLVEICVQHGISQVVISPGSRNAPLVIAFDSHPGIKTYVVHDERSAAFFALGLAEESKAPVAITCTSGSAPINYAPAVSEAYYRNIPLLVLTADRPVEWVDQGDGQTIRQKHLFQNFIKADFQLPNFPSNTERIESDEIVNLALQAVSNCPQGPVHINIPLAEPLYEVQDLESEPIIQIETEQKHDLSLTEKETIAEVWSRAERKLVLIGQLPNGEINNNDLKPLLNDPSVAILVENTTNIQDFQRVVHCIDRTLTIIDENDIEAYVPDLLVTMGGAIISKKIKAFLRNNKPKSNWRIGHYFFEEDTYASLTQSFSVSPRNFLNYLGEFNSVPNSNFGGKWKQADFLAEELHHNFLESATFSDLKAFDLILDTLPDDANLHMANSSVVRYCQLFNPLNSVSHYCNRGVSGIDGSTSTALGVAVSNLDKLNVLISGDISFFYDSNALWNSYLSANFRIIVINNGGGGIFRIIDGPNQSKQSEFFIAPFKGNIEAICNAFNVHHILASSLSELEICFTELYTETADQRPILLEVDTQKINNEKILKQYFQKIANKG